MLETLAGTVRLQCCVLEILRGSDDFHSVPVVSRQAQYVLLHLRLRVETLLVFAAVVARNTNCFAPFVYASDDPLDAGESLSGASARNSRPFVVQISCNIGRLDLCVWRRRVVLWGGVARNAIFCTAEVHRVARPAGVDHLKRPRAQTCAAAKQSILEAYGPACNSWSVLQTLRVVNLHHHL